MELAITSLGVVSPFGVGRGAWDAALAEPTKAAERAIRSESEVLDGEKLPNTRTAECWGFDPKEHLGKRGHRTFDRLTKFLIAAAKHALIDGGVKDGEGTFVEGAPGPTQIGICSATAYGSLDAITELNLVAELEDPRFINPSRFPNTVVNAAAGYVSIWEDLRAPNTTVVDGNCGALDAILVAATHLDVGRADAFLVGGGEVVSEPLYRALSRLGVVGPEGQGATMGEGAAYVLVERAGEAEGRGATILGRLTGYGTAFAPPESQALLVHGSADAVERACRDALAEAGLEPVDVDVVATATSGVGPMDEAEREGLRGVFGDEAPFATPKALHGETFGASGAFALAAGLSWIGGAPVHPLTQGQAPEQVRTVLISTIGYYGNASAVVLQAP
jgi:3-oxoacyl-[acyl-carrier-protein] synthase II